jgi:metallo-beta-lactamase family protein
MNRKLGFNPEEIDHIILSHAHIDHSGLIPYLYKLGFRGSVVCTNATRDLCSLMLVDCGHIQTNDVKTFNKRRISKGLSPVEPIYGEEEARLSMDLFIGVPYDRKFHIDSNISVKFTNTGHMLGSGVVTLEVNENGKKIRLAYTGDIGRPEGRILRSPEAFPQCDYLITETTYGNRLHPKMQDAENELLRVIQETCVDRKGKVIIPSFAVGRTQEILYSLNNFFNQGKLPKVNIYLDSPLAINTTEIFKMHTNELNRDVARVMMYDSDPFGFNSLYYIKSAQESKSLNTYKKPCVIISASGMMEAGRIKHHIANNIENPRNTILAVGYCSPTTLGARILSGADEISVFGIRHPVKAKIEKIEAFSGHGDYKEMADFISCQDSAKVKKVFLVHGEYESASFYANYIRKRGFEDIEIPEAGKEFDLN